MTSGIYCITNNINGKQYIGQSNDVKDRLIKHKSMLKCNSHYNPHLQSSWNKYGGDAFSFCVLKYCKIKYLDRFEKLYIRVLDSVKNGYNIQYGGKLYYNHSNETKRKISEAQIGEKNHNFGKTFSDEHKQRLSESKTGENNGFYGEHHSIESKLKMSRRKNTSGYFRVSKIPDPKMAQGFYWKYGYTEEDKRKAITSVDLEDLERKVREKGLEWIVL